MIMIYTLRSIAVFDLMKQNMANQSNSWQLIFLTFSRLNASLFASEFPVSFLQIRLSPAQDCVCFVS